MMWTPQDRARRAFLEMPDNPRENDFMEIVTAAVQAERNAGDQRLEDLQAALQAALEDLAKAKQQAYDNHIQTGQASAALSRVLLHVTGCSEGEFDTYMETAERIIEQLKEAGEPSVHEAIAALNDLAKANSALTSEQIAHGKTAKERDGLAAALTLLMNPHAERLNGYYRGKEWREYDDMRGSHYLANPWLSIGEVVTLLNAKRDAASIVAAHDRAVAARVLRGLAPQINEYDGKALLHEAALYEAGEREVPHA